MYATSLCEPQSGRHSEPPPPCSEWWRAFVAASREWPTLAVRFELFKEHLEQLGYRHDVPKHSGSVYLCLACSHGSDAACRLLEARYFPPLRAAVGSLAARTTGLDEVLQQLRCRLFVGPNAAVRSYTGRGHLLGWLRAVARTVALDAARASRTHERLLHRYRMDATCRELFHAAPPACPEQQLHHQRHTRAIQGALYTSIRALSARDRRMLSLYYVSGFTIDQLGLAYGIDRSTAARQLIRIVESIRRDLRNELIARGKGLGARDPIAWSVDSYPWLHVDHREMLGNDIETEP